MATDSGKKLFVGGCEIAKIEVIGLRQAEQQLRRHRALVALYQVDVARGNLQALGHLGLRQTELLADPAEAGADKQLLSGIAGHGSLANPIYDKIDNITSITSSYVT